MVALSARQRASRPRQDPRYDVAHALTGAMSFESALVIAGVAAVAAYLLAALIFPERF